MHPYFRQCRCVYKQFSPCLLPPLKHTQHRWRRRRRLPVVGRGKYCDAFTVVLYNVTVLLDLVTTYQHVYVWEWKWLATIYLYRLITVIILPKLFRSKKFLVTSGPNWMPTPRLLAPLPGSGWGSDQSNSHMSPSVPGCRVANLSIFRISSSVTSSLENRPPCTTRILFWITCANGRALKVSENN